MNKWIRISIGSAVVLLLLLFVLFRLGLLNIKSVSNEENGNQIPENIITYNGNQYIYNSDLTNILFLGIDTTDSLNVFTEPTTAGQSDAIFILTLNKATGSATILQINRNTMTDIDIYTDAGQVYKTMPGQVTLQYAYGNGAQQSAWAARKTISSILFNLPIDGYFAMNIEGISTINDAVGGVDVTMPCDYTVIDPSMTEGSTVHIIGDMAESFVRYRDINEFNSVSDRMQRQVLYITALLDNLCSRPTTGMYDVIQPYLNNIIITDLSAEEFENLSAYSYGDSPVYLLPGETVQGERFEEFYVDEPALEAYIVENYYLPY